MRSGSAPSQVDDSWFSRAIRGRARGLKRRVALPEVHDARVLAAVQTICDEEIATPVVVYDGSQHSLPALPPGAEAIDCSTGVHTAAIADRLQERSSRVRGDRDAALAWARTPIGYANGLLAQGEVHGVVAGAATTSADVLRSAIALAGLAPGSTTVSGAFYLTVPPFRNGGEVLTFADCAVVPVPTPRQLAQTALHAARERLRIVGDEPIVAFLSYSTAGSASGESVARIREAVDSLRSDAPWLRVDGELQGDAALNRDVALRKAPGSPVQGAANILIFPSLDSGNIAYKLMQRVARAGAVGPILQGLARPSNDLSRGCSVTDIVDVVAITALQSAPDIGS